MNTNPASPHLLAVPLTSDPHHEDRPLAVDFKEPLKLSDLSALGSTTDKVRKAFQDLFDNVQPDGICVNKEVAFNAVQPAITEQYGHPCHKLCGPATFERIPAPRPDETILGSQFAVNESDREATITLTVSGSWERSTTWSFSGTVGLTLSASVTIKQVFEIGGEVSVSVTAGVSGTQTESRSVSTAVTVTLPARSKQRVSIVAQMQKEAVQFTIPVRVAGMFGANFPHRVQGHYFWFLDASAALPRTTGDWVGRLDNVSAFNVHARIGPIEPI